MPRSADQHDLFADPGQPHGFAYRDNVLSPADARALLALMAELNFRPYEFQGYLGKRRIVAFGRRDGTADPLPDFLLPARALAAAFAGVPPDSLGHALINEYAPGAGVGWHRDRGPCPDVVGLSLGSTATLRLRRPQGTGWDRASQEVRPGSAYLLRGPARWDWEHSVPPVRRLRYSVTFRNFPPEREG
jgi:alkylated DNA repair dioxygenase AlkB